MRKPKNYGTLLGLGLALMLMSRPASAFPEFPQVILDNFQNTSCPVSCLLCHTSLEGSKGTVRQSVNAANLPPERGTGLFVENLAQVARRQEPPIVIRARKTIPTNAELKSAVNSLEAAPCTAGATQPCDSDGDGMTDYAELAIGADPDRFGNTPNPCPKYGCGASHIARLPAGSNLDDAAIACSALGLAFLLARRRQSARP